MHAREQLAAGVTPEALAHPELLSPAARALLDRHNATKAAALGQLDSALDQVGRRVWFSAASY